MVNELEKSVLVEKLVLETVLEATEPLEAVASEAVIDGTAEVSCDDDSEVVAKSLHSRLRLVTFRLPDQIVGNQCLSTCSFQVDLAYPGLTRSFALYKNNFAWKSAVCTCTLRLTIREEW